jgi:citrate/tricarballylate utilization protein
MQRTELTSEGARVMSVCNACRYCEQYCPVFKAMEQRLTFASADLNYLANLCHNCGECLYACQYAPPHEFAINVPKALARIRVQSYEQYAWPAALGAAFRHHDVLTALLLTAALIAVMLVATFVVNGPALVNPGTLGDFYSIVPHATLVALFGGVAIFVLIALSVGVARCWRDIQPGADAATSRVNAAKGGRLATLRDVLTLRHLHPGGENCTTAENVRSPWRRLFHHATFYGFTLCLASTSVAAVYHGVGWQAPYAYSSLPVLLGILGGLGLTVGPAGLLLHRQRRDPALSDMSQERLDRSFIVLLLLVGVTGLALLGLRHRGMMGVLLIVHLGAVLGFFLTMPYGKFVHGLYRTAALLKHSRERRLANSATSRSDHAG